MEQVFSALGFAKCFQVSSLHPATPFVVLAYAFAVIVEFVLTLFRQQFHQTFCPAFSATVFAALSAAVFTTFFAVPLNAFPIAIRVSRIKPDPLCLYTFQRFGQEILSTHLGDSWCIY